MSNEAAEADREWIRTLSPGERIAMALRLGEEGLRLFLAGEGAGLDRLEALAVLEAARNRGRRLCSWQRGPE